MDQKLHLALAFTAQQGDRLLSNLDDDLAGDPQDITVENVGSYLDVLSDFTKEEALEAGELSLLRAMLKLLISLDAEEAREIQGGSGNYGDLTYPGSSIGALPDDQWQLIFRYAYKRIFSEEPPTTPEEKAKIKSEVTITETGETLDQFRARMKAEGRLDK